MLFIDYPKQGNPFLVALSNTLPGFNKYVMEPKRFFIYLKGSNAHPLSNYGHKKYPKLIAWSKII
jgi:hypothetical protein